MFSETTLGSGSQACLGNSTIKRRQGSQRERGLDRQRNRRRCIHKICGIHGGETLMAGRFSSLFSPAAIERWWIRIPQYLGRYSSLLAAACGDGIYLTAWPRVAMLLSPLAFGFGLVEGASHWNFVHIWHIVTYGPVIAFGEISLLVAIGVVVGSLSANAGFMLVLGYAVGDFLWFGPQIPLNAFAKPLLPGFFYTRGPLLLSYVLFLMLTVVPTVSTNYLLDGLYRRMPGSDLRPRTMRIGVTAVLQGLFVLEWIFIAPMVLRVIWTWPYVGTATWSTITIGDYYAAASPWLEIAAVAAVIIRGWLTARSGRDLAVLARIKALDTALDRADQFPAFSRRLPP